MENNPKSDKRRAFDKAVLRAWKKNTKLINIRPTFIPDYKVLITLW